MGKSLESMNLEANILEEIPHNSFEHLINLKDLDLSQNLIKKVNQFFISLKRMPILDTSCFEQPEKFGSIAHGNQ